MVTEAGFGADLGAEKFVDIKCRKTGLRPDIAVVVATVRACKFHGGVELADVGTEDLAALEAGVANLRRHVRNLREHYGVDCVVAINRFPSDTDAEVALLVDLCSAEGVPAFPATHVVDGGEGARELAHGVLQVLDEPPAYTFSYTYEDELPLAAKVETLAHTLYEAGEVTWDPRAQRLLERFEDHGYGDLPVCIAKTQYSFSTDPTLRGAPSGHTLHVREVRLSAGAGFVVAICGDVMTMPGLPREPSATRIDLTADGVITGLS